MWIDTHCHFDDERFDSDRDAAADRAWSAGVEAVVIPGYVARLWPRLLQVCGSRSQPCLLPAPGLHPCYIREHRPEHLEQLDSLLTEHPECVAIGEIGLDTYVPELKETALYQRQQEFFSRQLQVAQRHDKPVILHVRKAHADIFRILQAERFREGGIVHAFSGGVEEAKRYVRLGFRLGIGGSLTYPQARRLHEVVAAVSLDALVLETDAPDMIPRPYRGEGGGATRNSPEYLPCIAEVLAAAKGVSLPELASRLRGNSRDALRWRQ
jgi:TatD DNase family protein